MPIQEVANELGRAGTAELIDWRTIDEQDRGRKSAQLIAAGKPHILIGLDSGKDKASGVFAGEPF